MKKLLSVVLALCMIASLCTMAITTVSAETETAPVISKETDFSVYFKEDGTVNDEEMNVAKTATTPAKQTYGKCTLSKSEAGNLVITPTVTTTFPSKDVSAGGKPNAYPVVTVWGETPDLKDAAYLAQGVEYQVTVKYKVNLVHSDSTKGVQVGVGYYNCGTTGGTANLGLSNRYIVARANHTEATDDWQTLTTTVTSANFNTYLVVGVYGKNSQVEIGSVTWERGAAAIVLNDGENSETKYAIEGDVVELPEKADTETDMFVGWYSSDYSESADTRHSIEKHDIPVAAITVTGDMVGKTTTYNAKYISKAPIKVDFDETPYQDGTYYSRGDTACQLGSETAEDDTVDEYATFTPDSWRHGIIRLYDDAGEVIVAYEGVTYNIEIDYEVTTANSENVISVVRGVPNNYASRTFGGEYYLYNADTVASADEVGRFTASKELTVKNTYVAGNGSRTNGYYQLNNLMTLYVRAEGVKVYSVEITPVKYTAPAKANIKNGTIDIDYVNGTVTAIPDEGYELKASGFTAIQTYNEYTISSNTSTVTSDNKTVKPILMTVAEDGDVVDGLTFKFDPTQFEGALLSSYRFDFDFVMSNESTVNATAIAVSTRAASGEGETYVSAGIRFRFRVSAQTVANAAQIEYVIVPDAAITVAGAENIETYIATQADGKGAAVIGIAKNSAWNTVYKQLGENFTDYQAVLTGLTDEAGKDLTNLKVKFALRITNANGDVNYVEYANAVAYSDYAN